MVPTYRSPLIESTTQGILMVDLVYLATVSASMAVKHNYRNVRKVQDSNLFKVGAPYLVV